MRITILGATGRIGSHLLTWALESGHQVRVLARNPEALPAGRPLSAHGAAARGPAAPDALAVTRGDVLDAAAVAEAVAGADAVLSALGPRGAKAPGNPGQPYNPGSGLGYPNLAAFAADLG